MKLILAPMEGVVDAQMRAILTRIGGIDRCVTEFIRVSDRVLPAKVFHRLAPELRHGGRTPAGTPVTLQLLGSDPSLLAGNALRAVALGAHAIDLNFGCPSKTVNRSRGGSVLLQEPELIHAIVRGVRDALPAHIPVSAKMRLGYHDKSLALENARAIEEGGAAEVCVHARTKVEGYRPPAHWEWIARIREVLTINVVANGDITSVEDYRRCRSVSGCDDVMIGRGLIARPDLAALIAAGQRGESAIPMSWSGLLPLLDEFFDEVRGKLAPRHASGRFKQWLTFLRQQYPEARLLFDRIREITNPEEIAAILAPAILDRTA